jgi:dCTP deaminase
MLVSGRGLEDLIKEGVVSADLTNVNASSIDLRLGKVIEVESNECQNAVPVDLQGKQGIGMTPFKLPYNLLPGQFCLAHTEEWFNLPDSISCHVFLKSSHARAGLNHSLAGWADPGWSGQLTLEYKNITQYNLLRLEPGMKCVQAVFFEHTPVPKYLSYSTKGSYNGSEGVTHPSGTQI